MRLFLTSDTVDLTHTVRRLLALQGHHVDEPTTVGAGALLMRSEWAYEAAIVVLWSKRPPRVRQQAVLVELGIVLGRSIPTLLISRPGQDIAALGGIPRIDTTGTDESLLELQIQLFLEGVRTEAPRSTLVSPPSTSVSTSTSARNLRGGAFRELEQQVAQLLSNKGGAEIAVGSESSTVDRPDFVLYVPGREEDIGVVMVEVRQLSGSEHASRRLRDARHQLSRRVLEGRAAFGLLIYDGPVTRSSPAQAGIVTYHVTELAERLEAQPLEQLLLQARNEAIHAL